MAHFYGTLQGSRGESTRCGTKTSGMEAIAASWDGAVRTYLSERDGVTHAFVCLIPWHGHGVTRVLYSGPVNQETHND